MAPSPSVVALPWYHRDDYPALLKLFSDPHSLPAAYDAWLERAEGIERQFQKVGFGVAKIWIRPVPFLAWWQGTGRFPGPARAPDFRERGSG